MKKVINLDDVPYVLYYGDEVKTFDGLYKLMVNKELFEDLSLDRLIMISNFNDLINELNLANSLVFTNYEKRKPKSLRVNGEHYKDGFIVDFGVNGRAVIVKSNV